MRHACVSAFSLIVLWASAAAAQTAFDVWTIQDGLPQSSVNDIHQTRDGYLWLATFGGLVRFDGVKFVVFDRATPGVRSLRLRALHEDRAGALWAASEDGMLMRYQDGRFKTFGTADGYPGGLALRIDEGHDGALWVMTIDRMIRYDGQRFSAYEPGQLPHDVRPRGLRGFQAINATVWWSRSAAGVHCLTRGQVELCLAAASLPSDEIVTVTADLRGAIWFHTSRGAVRQHEGTTRQYTASLGLPQSALGGLLDESRGGALLFRPRGGGLNRLFDGRVERVSDHITLSLFEDREGSIWFGTPTGGLHRIRHRAISMYTQAQGLSSNNVYALLRDRQGATWVGTWGGGLNRIDRGGTVVFRQADGLPADEVAALFEDRDGQVLVGTTTGLAIVQGGRVARYPDPSNWLGGVVWAIHQDEDGTFWFATTHGLVWQRGTHRGRYTSADGLADDNVTVLLRGNEGQLWIGTSRGLTRLQHGVFTSYTERDGLVGNHVRALAEYDGALWIGTYDGGLYRLAGNRLTRYTTADGLHDNGVFQLLDDGLGHLWMGSNRGISRVSRSELQAFAEGQIKKITAVVFGVADGLTSLECNGGRQPSGLKMPDGTLWLPTQGGVARVNPSVVAVNPHPPPVRIEDLRIAGAAVAPSAAGIETPPDRNSFEIQYTALSFVKPGQVRFRYRMIGLDEDWVDAGGRRTAAYHHVPPGRYIFHVIAANSDGVWNLDGERLAIVVMAPIWRQTWFLVLLAGVVMALVIAADRRRIGRLRREHARQQAYARQLLDTQEQERRRISNELHDSLGQTLFLIRQRARSVNDRGGDAAATETAMESIAGLAARASDEMKEIAYNLRPYQLDKIGLTRTIEGMLRRVGRACSLTFTTDIESVDERFSPDAQINVYRIVQEGLNNVVKHASATDVRVVIRRVDRLVEIEIRDNGQGCSPTSALEGHGFGLKNMQERARTLNGSVSLRSRPGDGTTLLVRLDPPESADGP
jgi:signal transduction histidine kinase/ligand-binding sensor domain-containing protein